LTFTHFIKALFAKGVDGSGGWAWTKMLSSF